MTISSISMSRDSHSSSINALLSVKTCHTFPFFLSRQTPCLGRVYAKRAWCRTSPLVPRLEVFAIPKHQRTSKVEDPRYMYIPPAHPQKRICGCAYIHIMCHYFSSIPLMFIRSCEVPRHQNRSVIVTLYILTNHRTAPLLEIR